MNNTDNKPMTLGLGGITKNVYNSVFQVHGGIFKNKFSTD